MARLDPTESFEALKDRVADSITSYFPHEGDKHVLELEGVEVEDDKDVSAFREQKKAKMGNRTWGVPVYGSFLLKDKKTGKVINRDRVKLATIPKITKRYSYIVDGTEYQVENLWRLKPGVYTRTKANGALESHFNVKGRGFHVNFDPESKEFKVRHGGAQPPLYPVMKALGVSDTELENSWGREILEANKLKQSDIEKKAIAFAKRLDKYAEINDYADATTLIKNKFKGMELNPEATKRTLGKEYKNITPDSVVATSKKLLGVARGKEKPDDRDSLMFKELMSIEDLMPDRLEDQTMAISRRIGNNIDRKRSIKSVVSPDLFGKPVTSFFAKTSLANPADQINPLEMVIAQQKTTILGGEGGIKSSHRITEEAKLVNASHMGVLDPLHTPEGDKTGVTLHLSLGAKKRGRNVTIPLFDLKKGKMVEVSPAEAFDSVVGLPDEVEWKNDKPVMPRSGKITASMSENKIGSVGVNDVRYMLKSPVQMFTIGSNMVPFLQNNSANRATMAGRQMEQAISLKHREQPLVQSVIKEGGKSFDEIMGNVSAIHAPISGKVVKVASDFIRIKDTDGKTHDVDLYDNYPLNDKKSFMSSEPVVKVGDEVKSKQLLADTNFSRGGMYAPGINLTTAYVPYKGLNYEDGIVISETASKKLTSEHLHKKSLASKDGFGMTKKKYRAYFPDRMTVEQQDKLDDDGVIKSGQIVMPGDIIVTGMAEQQLTNEQQKLRMMHKSLVKPYKDKAITWEEERPGKIVEVHRKRNGVTVHVKTEEPAEIGDKIVARHANKGILTSIVPDSEMPHTADGKPVDVLMNPLGVPGRLNIGQVLETAAGKLAEKRGKPYKLKNFDGADHLEKIKSELKAEGISDTENLKDPVSGKEIKDVFVGKQYMLKLQHQVSKKMSARSRDAYDRNLIPKGGGAHGAQSLGALGTYAMLAHGANSNLREFQTAKSDRAQGGNSDELWAALQAGEKLPPPKPTFAYKKFIGYMNAMGVNVEKVGNSLNLMPLTDKQVLNMSHGEIKDGGRMIKTKDMEPEKGGLFDLEVTGGLGGDKWSHIKLKEPMPNPLFQKAIMSVSGIRGPDFNAILEGTKGVTTDGEIVSEDRKDAVYGPGAFSRLLNKVDVNKELTNEEGRIGKLTGQNLNESNRRVKYLRALKKLDMKPTEAYMMKNVPVLPPAMRPLSVMDDGSLNFDDVNQIYKHVSLVNQKLGQVHRLAPDEEKNPLRAELYDNLKALTGIGGTLNRQYPGILDTIAGTSPKMGFVQDKLVKRKQDMSMRSTIIPDPALSLDEVGIPRKAAMEMYKPFVVRELRRASGMTPLSAQKAIKEDRDIAHRALENVVKERPVLLKRDPVLHKYGIQAFQPKLTTGKAIKIHPLVTGGFNADFDGDSVDGQILVELSEELRCKNNEVKEIFMPHDGNSKISSNINIMEIKNFPRLENTARFAEKGIVYKVPDGVRVPACYTDKNGCPQIKMFGVTEFSTHPECKEWLVRTKNGRELICSGDHSLAVFDPEQMSVVKMKPKNSVGKCAPVMRDMLSPVKERMTSVPTPDSKISVNNSRFASLIKEIVPGNASSKKLPGWILDAPLEFRQGLFKGLIDSDGSANWSKPIGKRKEQFGMSYTSTSKDLIDGVKLLAASLGIPSTCTEFENRDKTAYILSFSTRCVLDSLYWMLPLAHKSKNSALEKLSECGVDYGRNDIVPVTKQVKAELLKLLKNIEATSKGYNRNKAAFSQYVVLQRSDNFITRTSVERLYGLLSYESGEFSDVLRNWWTIVLNVCTSWDVIESVEPTGNVRTMYDLTVPDAWTFTMADGLVVWDTMAAFVPISNAAVKEANNMKPSKLLFSPSTYDVMYAPGKEMQVGLYLMTEKGKRVNKKFENIDEMEKAHNKGELKMTDVVKMGNVTTTLGRARIDSKLPKNMQGGDILTNLNKELDKGAQKDLFSKMAKSSPKEYPRAVNAMKNLGNDFAYEDGFSFGLKDFSVHRDIRDKVFKEADTKAKGLNLNNPKDAEKFVDVYFDAMQKMKKDIKNRRDNDKYKTRLTKLDKASGIKGDGLNQITGAPVLFVDSKGDVVTSPVRRSYSEGLKVSDYWANVAGGRKGIVQKVQSVRDPGYLSKLMVNSTMNQVVDTDDCGSKRGIRLSVLEPDVVGRYTAADIKVGKTKIPANTLVDTEILDRLKNSKVSKIVVRSPMRCNHSNGLCAKCFGLNENGDLPDKGTNIGVIAAQSLGEPGTQMAMKSFHCLHAKTLVTVRSRVNMVPFVISMEELFNFVDGPIIEDGEEEYKECSADNLLINNGVGWTDLQEVRRHAPSRPMIMVSDGSGVTICQDNHPIAYRPNLIQCERCGYHRLKKPGKNATIKNGKWFCPKCNLYQYPPDKAIGDTTQFEQAGELEPKRVYLERFLLPHFELQDDPDINPYVAGMYVSEGCISYRWTNPNNRIKKPYSFTICQKPGEIRDKLEKLLPKSWNFKSKSRCVEIHSLELSKSMERMFGRYSRNVSLPPMFLSFSGKWLSNFLAGLIDGDGSKKSDTDGADRIAIDTTSFELAQQVVMICAKLDIVSNLHSTKIRKRSKHQGFRVVLRVTEAVKDLLDGSLKVSTLIKLSPDQKCKSNCSCIMTSKKEVMYTDDFVYDVKTLSGTFVGSGLLNHNSGGVYEGKSETSIAGAGLDRAKTLLNMPKVVKGSAVLSKSTGRITSVRKDVAGGYNVTVGTTTHYVPQSRKLPPNMRAGTKVRKGDPLTLGPVNPHEMLPLTGISRVQGQLASELHNIYGNQGIRRRNSEVVVRALSNITKIEDPGDSRDYVKGDMAPTTVVQDWNNKVGKNGKPIAHSPIMRGVKQVPLDMQEDWLARLNHEKLKETIIEGSQRGWESDIHGTHPVPPLIYSAEFGKGKPY